MLLPCAPAASVPFEKLHLAFMLFGGFKAGKRAQVAPLARCIFLARIEPELPRFEFANHIPSDAAVMVQVAPAAGLGPGKIQIRQQYCKAIPARPLNRCGNGTLRDGITSRVRIRARRIEMTVDTMEKLFVEELKDLYSAEKQITRALPKMAKKASNEQLKTAFETHLEQTQGQIQRLDRVFEILGKSSSGKTCKGMQGLLEEGSETMQEAQGEVLDAAMICAAQKVEHYEMAAYGSVRTWAQQLGQKEIADLLQQTLEEEGETDHKLTQLAGKINKQAQRHAA
jgi:ferritin-like metal-binding protein YciE